MIKTSWLVVRLLLVVAVAFVITSVCSCAHQSAMHSCNPNGECPGTSVRLDMYR